MRHLVFLKPMKTEQQTGPAYVFPETIKLCIVLNPGLISESVSGNIEKVYGIHRALWLQRRRAVVYLFRKVPEKQTAGIGNQ